MLNKINCKQKTFEKLKAKRQKLLVQIDDFQFNIVKFLDLFYFSHAALTFNILI